MPGAGMAATRQPPSLHRQWEGRGRSDRRRSLPKTLRCLSAPLRRPSPEVVAESTDQAACTPPLAASQGRRRVLLAGAAGLALLGLSPGKAVGAGELASTGEAIMSPTGRIQAEMARYTTEFVLSNGLRFLVYERHVAPIVSCRTYAAVGAFDEEDGSTGIAHLLEHMAFKGTEAIGTTNFRQEAPLLDAMDEVFYELRSLRSEAPSAVGKAKALEEQLAELQRAARQYQVPNAFGALLEREGGVGLNAATSQDSTQYFVSLPTNKLELWMAMEAQRFQAPVFRELYSEKKVVLEERSQRIDQAPLGHFLEDFKTSALQNNYRRPTIGYKADIESLGRRELQDFFEHHYGPSSLTIAVVGDVDPQEVQRLAEKYFGGWQGPQDVGQGVLCSGALYQPAGPQPGLVNEITASSPAGPLVMDGYYYPSAPNCSIDGLVRDVIMDILYSTRSSRLYRNLVETGQALSCSCLAAYPGDKYPGMSLLYAVPAPGATNAECAKALRQQALASYGVSETELTRVKKGYLVESYDSLVHNSSLASMLVQAQNLAGDWRVAAQELQTLQEISNDDIQRVTSDLFQDGNRFSGYVLNG